MLNLRFVLAPVMALALAAPLSAQQIGTVASSEPTLRGTPPGGSTQTLSVGSPLVSDQSVASSASGRAQLLFADQTTLSMAPNTTIVLDRFVFDPSGGGEMGLSLTQGALRFIGGSLSRQDEATITTPAATIGIRGSTAIVVHLNGQTFAVFVAGDRLCISVGGSQSCTSRQGGVLSADGYIGRVNPDWLRQILALIDGPVTGPIGGGSAGTGQGSSSPSNDNANSPDGEQFDPDVFDDTFTLEDLRDLLPDGPGEMREPIDECEFFDDCYIYENGNGDACEFFEDCYFLDVQR